MSADFIHIRRDQSAATEAGELLGAITELRSAYERLSRARAKMRHNFDDGGGENSIDWSAVETLYGVPVGQTSVGPIANGAKLFTLVDGTVGALEGSFQNSNGVDLTVRVG